MTLLEEAGTRATVSMVEPSLEDAFSIFVNNGRRWQMVSNTRLFYMAVWRDWLDLKRYKLNFVFALMSSALFGVGMLLFALAFDSALLESTLGTTN